MKVCSEARAALVIACQNDAPIANLELIGLNVDTIELLERGGIVTINKLMRTTSEGLFQISGFGSSHLSYIYKALGRYHLFAGLDAWIEMQSSNKRCIIHGDIVKKMKINAHNVAH